MADDLRHRILEGTVRCLGQVGIAKTTVDDAARAADVSRASIYRYFPDGKDELISAAIEHAVTEFFTELAAAVADAADIAELLERALLHAHRAVLDHEVLQKVAETEPERLMPQLSQSAPLVRRAISDHLAVWLAKERLRPGVTADEAGRWLARMMLSFLFGGGLWDLTDPVAVRRLVRDELLVGIIDGIGPEPGGVPDHP